jgi:tetratricopeptide (TPR) repeat protein
MRLDDLLDEGTLKKVGTKKAFRLIGSVVQRCPEAKALTQEQGQALRTVLSILEQMEALADDEERILFVRVIALRKLGRVEEALSTARAAEARVPSWTSATLIAGFLKRSGDLEGAVALCREAAVRQPQDVSALLEAGDILLDQDRWGQALECYEAALQREEDQPWGLPSAYYCRYRLTGEARWLELLQSLAAEHPDECGLRDGFAQLTGKWPPGDRRRRAVALLKRLESPEGEP